MLLSVPGVLAAALIRLRVKEPRAHLTPPPRAIPSRPSLRGAVAALCAKRSFVQLCVGFGVWGLASGGMGQWLPAFFIRTYHVSLTQVGLLLGLSIGGSLCIGLILGGWMGNWLLPRDLRWGLRLPMLAMCLYTAVTIGALLAPSMSVALGLFFVAGCLGGLVVAPLTATVGGLVSPDVRALSLAVMGLLSALIGSGLGPVTTGLLSDGLRRSFGGQSLRYSLALMTALILWGVVHLHLASKHLLDEFEDRPERQEYR